MTCPRTIALGAYVLGALEREERSQFEGHLETCATCRGELARLAPLPGLLSRLSTDEAEQLAEDTVSVQVEAPAAAEPPPRALLDGVLGAVARRRRRGRLAAGAVAFALAFAALAVVAGGGLLRDEGGGAPAPLTTAASDPSTGVQASAELIGKPWGTSVHLTLAGVRPGQRCRLVARTIGGRAEVAATWRATYLGTAEVPGAVATPPDRLLALDVVGAGGHVLVRMPVSVD